MGYFPKGLLPSLTAQYRGEEELPRAYIVPKVGRQISSQDIMAFVERLVSKTKRITGGVRFVDAIPKNPSGKILRKVLRQRASMEDSQSMSKL